jgi:hypothetical protein
MPGISTAAALPGARGGRIRRADGAGTYQAEAGACTISTGAVLQCEPFP